MWTYRVFRTSDGSDSGDNGNFTIECYNSETKDFANGNYKAVDTTYSYVGLKAEHEGFHDATKVLETENLLTFPDLVTQSGFNLTIVS